MDHIFLITYTDSKVVLDEIVIAVSIPIALEKFNKLINVGYIDIVGIVEVEISPILRSQAGP